MHQIIASYEIRIENIYTQKTSLCVKAKVIVSDRLYGLNLGLKYRFIKITWCRPILGSQCDPSPLLTKTRILAVPQHVPQRSILMRTWGSND